MVREPRECRQGQHIRQLSRPYDPHYGNSCVDNCLGRVRGRGLGGNEVATVRVGNFVLL
jgi:hypothetical protein